MTVMNVKVSFQIAKAHVLDVVPTLLEALDLPVGKNMDGQSLTEAILDEYLKSHPITYADIYDTLPREALKDADYGIIPGEEELKEKLRGLGYL